VVEQIWSDVATEHVLDLASAIGPPPEFKQLVLDEERRYLNANAILTTEPAALPAVGRMPAVKSRAKARAGRFVVTVLDRYFASEHEFIAHLVRLLNKITVHHDEIAEGIRALHEALRGESVRLRQANSVLHGRMAAKIEAPEREIRALRAGDSADRV